MMRTNSIVLATLTLLGGAARAETTGYQKPAKAILDVLHARMPPNFITSPARDAMILATRERYPPISDLARPMLRLGGTRIDPGSNNLHNALYFRDYTITRFADGAQIKVALPDGARPGWPQISADGKRFAFSNQTPTGVEVWSGDMATGKAHRLGRVLLNPVLYDELRWMPDQHTLLVKLVPDKRGPAPATQAAPEGPKTEESSGETVASSTYETRDVLKNPHDATLFDYYATSQLALIDADSGVVTPVGKPAVYVSAAASPDGKALLVQYLHRPYSYITTFDRFPREVELWDTKGALLHKLASLPLVENVPIWGVPTGPRDFDWRANAPQTILYAEALDGGDWNKQTKLRDRVLMVSAPWRKPVEVTQLPDRFGGVSWLPQGGGALVTEYDPIKHWRRTTLLDVDKKASRRVVWDLSSDDQYKDPGNPVTRTLPNGFEVVEQQGDDIFTYGTGGSPDGDRPFFDRWSLKTISATRLFRSGKTDYEQPFGWIDAKQGTFLTRAESTTEHPNYFVRTLGAPIAAAPAGEAAFTSTARKITSFADPTPALRGITKRLVKYKRADGVDLSFTLYLPPGYKEGTPLPTVVWAYPLDYADASMAGQVSGSTQRFTLMGWPLHLFFLLDGYAVIDNPSLPVVGDQKKIYDTYMEQLVAGAKAAVDKAVALGVTDPERVGITGHSHGGLMTVNLLAHTDLFRAGIARSGSYNKTLTAFGFQTERRTLWKAQDVYLKVSPYFYADKIKQPLLLIHGDADYNPGTIPLQSEQLYQAVRGNGGHVRLVMLPFESHGYQAMESTEHVLWEMLGWFDRYVKQAPRRGKVASQR